MSLNQQLELARTPEGRIVLHLLTRQKYPHYKSHIAGIKRELNGTETRRQK